jgi:hypothetical protein
MAGLSLFAGFAAARFLKASADRRDTAVRVGSGPRGRQGAKRKRPANISSPAATQANAQAAGGSSSSGSEGASASPTSGAERNRSDGQ